MRRYILDTDIGDDIDDALALAFALNLDDLNLVGITTVHREVATRARLAAKLLKVMEFNTIPVSVGLSDPLKRPVRTETWIDAQAKALSVGDREDLILNTPACRFIRDMILDSDVPTTLVAIGPLTNIAQVLIDDAKVKSKIDEIVIMGGFFARNEPEYNIWVDPEAADIVFHSQLPITLIPLDITQHCRMSDQTLSFLTESTTPYHRLLYQLICLWQDKFKDRFDTSYPWLHDLFNLGYLAAPEIFTFERWPVEVVLKDIPIDSRKWSPTGDSACYGITRRSQTGSNIKVCTKVDYDAFQSLFHSSLTKSKTK